MENMKQQIINTLQSFKQKHADEGVHIIGMFGSYADGKYDDFSDVDVAYKIDYEVFSKKYRDGFSKILRIEEIKQSLEKILHKKVDFVSLDSNNKRFIEHIQKEMLYV